MTERGQALLEEQPPWRRQDQTVRAVCNAAGEEFAVAQEQLDIMQRTMHPLTAEEFLTIYEDELGISVGNPGMTLEERQNAVLAFMSRMVISGSGVDWEAIANILIQSGVWTYEVAGTKNNALSINLPYPAGSIQANLIEQLFRTITPAVMTVSVSPSPGFILDESPLDEDNL